MADYFILEGKTVRPASLMEWAEWFENNSDERIIAKTEFPDSPDDVVPGISTCRVSTVFLGLDHNFGSGPPHIFETMVFDGPMNGETNQYSTWEEAEAGHKAMCAYVQKELGQD